MIANNIQNDSLSEKSQEVKTKALFYEQFHCVFN